MKFLEIVFIHIPLIFIIILLQLTVVSASIDELQQGRKHSTAHYSPNDGGTVYILGGIEFLNTSTTQSQLASFTLTLRIETKDFSLHSNNAASSSLSNNGEHTVQLIPPTTGHTSHLHVPSNSIISCFGIQQDNKASPPLIPSPSSSLLSNNTHRLINNKVVPASRHQHTSALINDRLYVIGGEHVATTKLIETNDMIWEYSFSSLTWRKIHNATAFTTSMAGHSTVVYNNQWLISCFGQQEREGLIDGCTWFNVATLKSTKISPSSIKEWPTARLYASMISVSNNEFILFGGETAGKTILDDVWKLSVNSTSMTWTKINYKNSENYNYKRSGHASTLLGEHNVVLYYGGQNGPHSLATDPIYLDISKMEWIRTKNMNGDNSRTTIHSNGVDMNNNNLLSSDDQQKQEKHGLSGGAIGGIIVGVIGVCAVGIGFFVWKKRLQRQQDIHQKSRAARFSQSPTPMFRINKHREEEKTQPGDYNRGYQGDKQRFSRANLANTNFLSLPELALSHQSNHSRISTLSLGAEFRFSADDYRRHSQLSSDSAVFGDSNANPNIDSNQHREGSTAKGSSNSSFSRQPLESLSEEENHDKEPSINNYKRRESTGFKRLTLNLFSGSQQQNDQTPEKKKDRSSSLFQLRASRLLQPGTPATPDGRYPLPGKGGQSRASLGAKSVSSVQWVGFNDNMDYKGNNWRDSSASSMHLAVKNARASSYYTSDSAQSTPRSPMFPAHLQDSAAYYHANENEANSWKKEVDYKEST